MKTNKKITTVSEETKKTWVNPDIKKFPRMITEGSGSETTEMNARMA